jgi:hypothetical protein
MKASEIRPGDQYAPTLQGPIASVIEVRPHENYPDEQVIVRFQYVDSPDIGVRRYLVNEEVSAIVRPTTTTQRRDTMANKTILHADESFVDPESRNFQVVAITDNEPGYRVVSDWPTLDEAKDQVDAYNANLGLTADEILDIRVRSMAAHNVQKYGEPEADPRHVHYTDEPVEEITVQQAQLIEAATALQGVIEEVIPSRVSHWLIESLRTDLRDLLNPEHRGYAGKITTKDAMF